MNQIIYKSNQKKQIVEVNDWNSLVDTIDHCNHTGIVLAFDIKKQEFYQVYIEYTGENNWDPVIQMAEIQNVHTSTWETWDAEGAEEMLHRYKLITVSQDEMRKFFKPLLD